MKNDGIIRPQYLGQDLSRAHNDENSYHECQEEVSAVHGVASYRLMINTVKVRKSSLSTEVDVYEKRETLWVFQESSRPRQTAGRPGDLSDGSGKWFFTKPPDLITIKD
jgi:hypothetical protein